MRPRRAAGPGRPAAGNEARSRLRGRRDDGNRDRRAPFEREGARPEPAGGGRGLRRAATAGGQPDPAGNPVRRPAAVPPAWRRNRAGGRGGDSGEGAGRFTAAAPSPVSLVGYAVCFRRRSRPTRPRAPMERSAMLAGSGTTDPLIPSYSTT